MARRYPTQISSSGHKKTLLLAASLATLMSLPFASAQADATQELLEFLKDKGVMNEKDFQRFKAKFEQEEVRKKEEKEVAEAFQAAKNPDAVKGSFKNGIIFESADKRNSIQLEGQVQADYREFGGPNVADSDTFDIRRAQLGAKGKFWEYYDFLVRGDFASISGPTTTVCTNAGCTATANVQTGTSSELNQAYLGINWWKEASFRFGQFKMPMSMEEQTSSRFLDFQERSLVDNSNLVAGRERGAMIHGVPYPGIYYGLAYSTGQGVNTNDTNNRFDNNDVVGRAVVNFGEMFNRDAVVHVGASFSNGDLPAAAASSVRTEARGITFFSPAPFTTQANQDMERQRFGAELALAYGPVKFQSEYGNANFDGRSAARVHYDKDIKASYAALNWLVTGESYPTFYKDTVFGRIIPKTNFSPYQPGAWGAWELGLRYSEFDASDFTLQNGGANPGTGVLINSATTAFTNEADAWTLGLKWIPVPNVRLMMNYITTDFDTPVRVTSSGKTKTFSNEDAVTFRAQFDF